MIPLEPVILSANQPAPRAYRGGAGIARFRGVPDAGPFAPEDFVGSTTEVAGGGGIGLTTLPDGQLLRDAIAQDPTGYLGEQHTSRFGADPELLVKLLDTGERLFVHFHPDGPFAHDTLGLPRGKTEAWIIVATEGEVPAPVYLGFTRDVSSDEVARWVDDQDVPAMLEAMHHLEVSAGDTLFVPATLAHSIGAGVTLVELQQPADISILLEYRGFGGLTDTDAFFGLDAPTALAELDRSGWSADRVAGLVGRGVAAAPAGPAAPSAGADVPRSRITSLFGPVADPFFRADFLDLDGEGGLTLDPGFSILVILAGAATLSWVSPELPPLDLAAGQTVLVPFGAGEVTLAGRASAIRCRPPRP